jgi:hypothetical protein
VIYYDKAGKARAFGAEALQESIVEKADDEGWARSSWYGRKKMYLHVTLILEGSNFIYVRIPTSLARLLYHPFKNL